jgi:hypothetical protein
VITPALAPVPSPKLKPLELLKVTVWKVLVTVPAEIPIGAAATEAPIMEIVLPVVLTVMLAPATRLETAGPLMVMVAALPAPPVL